MGIEEQWANAEAALTEVLDRQGREYELNPGHGGDSGRTIDVQLEIQVAALAKHNVALDRDVALGRVGILRCGCADQWNGRSRQGGSDKTSSGDLAHGLHPSCPENAVIIDLSVSNSLSGRNRELDEVPTVAEPTHLVRIGRGHRVSVGERQRRATFQGGVAKSEAGHPPANANQGSNKKRA